MIEVCWNSRLGLLLRIDGITSPATLDFIEQTHGQAVLDDAMEHPNHYREILTLPALRPITSVTRKLNPAAWGQEAVAS